MAGRCKSCTKIVPESQNYGSKSEPLCKSCFDIERQSNPTPVENQINELNENIEVKVSKEKEALINDLCKPTESSNDSFSLERKGVQKGILGGIIMMVIAAVWFIGGWVAGYIFFYPPILFIIGLFAFFKGMFTGNLAGKKDPLDEMLIEKGMSPDEALERLAERRAEKGDSDPINRAKSKIEKERRSAEIVRGNLHNNFS